jgi:hypothetical protein
MNTGMGNKTPRRKMELGYYLAQDLRAGPSGYGFSLATAVFKGQECAS